MGPVMMTSASVAQINRMFGFRFTTGLIATGLTMTLTTGPVLAQTPSGIDAGSLLRQEESAQQLPPAPLPEFEAEEPLPELTGIGGVTVRVKEVRFTGATELLSESDLQATTAEAIGQDLDFDGLKALAARVTRRLKDEGWFLARAYLPRQDVTEGIITISILAGRLDRQGSAFEIQPLGERALRIRPEVLTGIAAAYLPAGAAVRESELDRSVLLMNDLPGISARARLEPGEAPDSTRVLISAAEDKLISGSLIGSNFGNRSTGSDQVTANINANDPLRIGDRLTLGITYAKGLTLGQFSYQRPLGSNGLQMNLGYTDLRYKVVEGSSAEAADYTGDAQTASLGLRYPIIRSRNRDLWGSLRLGHDAFEDRLNGDSTSDKRVLTASVGLQGSQLDPWQGGGRWDWSIMPTWGNLSLARSPDAQRADASTFRTAGSFGKLEYSLSRLQSLKYGLSLYASLNGQAASKNLDSSQKFQPAGPNGVRAYPGGEASADQGQLVKAELRYDRALPEQIGNLQLSVFYDVAWVGLSKDRPNNVAIDTRSGDNHYRIEGAGVGLSLSQPGRYLLRAIWARKIGDNPGANRSTGLDSDERDDRDRFWLQGVLWF